MLYTSKAHEMGRGPRSPLHNQPLDTPGPHQYNTIKSDIVYELLINTDLDEEDQFSRNHLQKGYR